MSLIKIFTYILYKLNGLPARLFISVALICQLTGVLSQNTSLRFKYITNRDGLSNPNIYDIVQDKYGIMWFASEDGLTSYDGYNYKVYKHDADISNSLSSGYIRAIAATPEGNLWLGVSDGIDYFDNSLGKFTHYLYNQPEGGTNDVFSICLDKNGNLWYGVREGGLNYLDKKTKIITRYLHIKGDPHSISNNYITAVYCDNQQRIWAGTVDGILELFDKKTGQFHHIVIQDKLKGKLNHFQIRDIMQDNAGNIWITTSGSGVYKMEEQQGNYIFHNFCNIPGNPKSLSNDFTTQIIQDQKGGFWIGTENGGLDYLYPDEKQFRNYLASGFGEGSIDGNSVWSVYQDKSGNLWVGVFNKGVNVNYASLSMFKLYRNNPFNKNSLSWNIVSSFCEDHLGNIWVGTDGGGINLFDPVNETFKHYNVANSGLGSDAVLSVYEDKSRNMWVGTWQGGLNRLDRKTGRFTQYTRKNSGLGCDNIICITEDNDGALWIGTFWGNGGISRYDPKTHQFVTYTTENSNLPSNTIFTIEKGPGGNLWIGTLDGLSMYNPKENKFTNYSHNESDSTSLSHNTVISVLCSNDSTIWIGTASGLNKLNLRTNTFTRYFAKNGLPSDAVIGIEDDGKGNIWLSTNNGLSKFNPVTNTFRNFDISDGLQDLQFYRCSHYKDKNGNLYFGGPNGFNVFNPDEISDKQIKPAIYLTDFKIFYKSVPIGTKGSPLSKSIRDMQVIKIPHRYSTLTFEYIALNYASPEKINYAYKMEPYDKEWNYVGTQRSASYTNLNPGKYIFRVMVPPKNGIANEEGISLQVIIVPPVWRTWWFYSGEILFILLLIYLYIKFRERKLKNDKKILQEKVHERTLQIEHQKEELEQHRNHLEKLVETRTEELIAAKEKAEESDKLKSAFLANMSHEIRTPMNAIVGFSSLLKDAEISAEERNEFIQLINSNSESLLVLIEDILDLSLIEANQVVIRKENIQLDELVDTVYSSFALSNKKPNLEIRLNNQLRGQNLELYTDKFRMKQILANLMNNAYKFTEKGFIELAVDMVDHTLIFKVIDTGVGISDNDLHHIFERFRKLEQNKINNFKGAGLGLAISKRLGDLLGARLSVESVLGSGTTFTFAMPYKVAKTNTQTYKPDSKITVFPVWDNKKILIVEDEKANFLYLQKILKRAHAQVIWAQNGPDALKLIDTAGNFDIILMDIKMPFMNGYETAKRIREKIPTQVIIAQTAYARPEDEINIRMAGFNGYLAKPIKTENLLSMITKYMI